MLAHEFFVVFVVASGAATRDALPKQARCVLGERRLMALLAHRKQVP
jgi:hypothetical protein